ncbi:MAG: hypothetical protein RJA50_448 [Actinomycetota bacterium]|jgi:uncharacterized protein YdhG (YjbR/CyaY superfamily)
MPATNSDRSKHFAAIERKHGEKAAVWLKRLKDLETTKYPEQIAFLRENHGFSQAHANALVMYHRGSKSSNKFGTPENYFKSIDPQVAKTIKKIFAAVTTKHKNLELVMAWNQPMLRNENGYVIGVSVSKNHLTLNPFSTTVLNLVTPKLAKYEVKKHTFLVPLDWKVDSALMQAIAKARIAEITKK